MHVSGSGPYPMMSPRQMISIDGAGFDFSHHRAEGDGIRMDVTDDGDAH